MKQGSKKCRSRIKPKWLSPGLFGLAIVLFFLPFICVSCEGEKIATFAGIELVTGKTLELEPSVSDEELGPGKAYPEALAIVAFVAAWAGLGLSFLKGRKSALPPAFAGSTGLVASLLLIVKIEGDVIVEGERVLEVRHLAGFSLTGLAFVGAAGLDGWRFLRRKAGGQPLGQAASVAVERAPPITSKAQRKPLEQEKGLSKTAARFQGIDVVTFLCILGLALGGAAIAGSFIRRTVSIARLPASLAVGE